MKLLYLTYPVLDVTIWGCRVWELRGKKGGGQTCFNFAPATAEHCPCFILPLVEPRAWKVYDTKVLPPSAVAGCQSTDTPAGVIFTIAGSPGASLLHWAANRAFNNLTNTYLKLAWVKNSVAGPVPTTATDLLEGLVRHTLLKIKKQELITIFELRGEGGITQRQEHDKDFTTIFEDPALAQAAEELLDSSDKQELETVKKLVARELKMVAAGTAGVTGGASSSSGLKAVRPQALPVLHSKTLYQARSLAPVGKGCPLTKESKRHNRSCGEYLQRSGGSKYHKRTFSDPASEAVALKGVLAWLWSVHQECTGEASPWLFD